MRISRESIGKSALRCAVIAILFIFPALSQAQSRIVTVSPDPAGPVASGTALRNALAGIPSPSATNPWLLKIEPGIYDVQFNPLQMRSWVSIEGSGIEATTIRGNIGYNPQTFVGYFGMVEGANNAELRNLTVENTGSGQHRIAMLNRNASPRVYRVRFITQGDDNKGLYGILNLGLGGSASPILEEIEVRVTGGSLTTGIAYEGAATSAEIHRSRIVISGGTTRSHGILLHSGRLQRIRDTIIETYFGASASGIYVLSANPSQDLWLTNTTIISESSTQSNYGINCNDAISINVIGSQILVNNQLQAIGIRQLQNSGTIVLNSYILAATAIVSSNGNVFISNSVLAGGPVTATGSKGCFGVTDEAGGFYTGPCPP